MEIQHNLIDFFSQYFEVVPADTPQKLQQCYRLRYEVYYKEGILPGNNLEDYPDGLEYDEYDRRSVQCLLIHKPKQRIVGTVRIILADPDQQDNKFPLETVAGDLLISDVISHNKIQRSQIGEVSRLIIAPEFRARKGEDQRPYGVPDDFENSLQKNERRCRSDFRSQRPNQRGEVPRRMFPHAVIGLFVAVMRMSDEHNLTCWFGAMEPVCARFLRSFGIHFEPVSPILDYHGRRQGYIGFIPDIIKDIYRVNPQLGTLLTENNILFSGWVNDQFPALSRVVGTTLQV